MKQNLIISIGAIALLGGCSTFESYIEKFKSLSCEENVLIASHSLVATSQAVAQASKDDLIDMDKRPLIVKSIEGGLETVEYAGSLCPLDEVAAEQILGGVQIVIRNAHEAME